MGRPTPQQLAWQRAAFGMFCHFGVNTFNGREWSDGTLDAASFNPSAFDARQWVQTAVDAGMRYLVLTAKHHDGFCLWPTSTTDYSVAASPYAGDVVGEVATACADAGLPFGLYLSPWDRNADCYRDPTAYDDFYCRQLTELCTQYGPLFEVWFDGAGSEGRTYDWNRIMGVVHRHQPDAVVFNMGEPTIRWIGNEDGLAADPCHYDVDGVYLPPECDVAIRRNWFWQPDDLDTLKSVEHLLGIYYRSVGLGANLLLNVPPDRRGLIDEDDRTRLLEFAEEVRRRFAAPVRGELSHEGDVVTVTLPESRTFDHVVLHEDVSDGQHVDGHEVYVDDALVARGETIGVQRFHVFPAVTGSRVTVRLGTARARLADVELHATGVEALPQLGRLQTADAEKAR